MTNIARARIGWSALLILFGAGWGLTQPLAKITVSAGYAPFGILFWQTAIGALLLAVINVVRRGSWPISAPAIRAYAAIAVLGTLIPNSASYTAVAHLPSGVMSIVIAAVPLFAFPLSILLRHDRFGWGRFMGVLLGLAGVVLIAVPGSSLRDRAAIVWLPLALLGPFCYALEGLYVASRKSAGPDALQILLGASVIGALVIGPLALATGQFIVPTAPYAVADAALLAIACLHALIYVGYVWMVGKVGAVFAAQVSYLVTGFGVVWAMLILSESYSLWIWAAMGLMMVGITLVRPADAAGLAQIDPAGDIQAT